MKNIEKYNCSDCDEIKEIKKLYRLSYRYQDKKNTYRKSKIKIIHTGYTYLCEKCLKKILKILN